MEPRRSNGPALLLAAALAFGAALYSLKLVLLDNLALGYAFAFLLLALTSVATVIEPFIGLLAYIIVTYLRPADWYVMLIPLRIVMTLAGLTCFIWLTQFLIRRKPSLVRHPVLWNELGVMLAAFWSMLSVSILLGARYVGDSLAKAMALSAVIANLTRTAQRLRVLCWVVVVSAAINSLLAWKQLLAGDPTIFADRAAGVGVLGDPNDLALTLVAVLPLALALWVGERGFYRRLALGLVIGALLGGVLISQSRGGALGMMAVLLLEGYDRLHNRRTRMIYAVVGLLMGLAGFAVLSSARGQDVGDLGDDPNVYNRKGAWVGGLQMLKAYPLTGVGIYQFPDRLDEFGPPYLEQRTIVAHNSYVQVAAELGLPGITFFGLMLFYAWRSTGRSRTLVAQVIGCERTLYYLAWAMRRALVGWAVCAFFLAQAYQVWIYLLLGIMVATETTLSERVAAQEAAA